MLVTIVQRKVPTKWLLLEVSTNICLVSACAQEH